MIGSVIYIPKGPLLACNQGYLADLVVKEIVQISQNCHAQLLAVQPPNTDTVITARLPSLGFSPSILELAPTASVVLDLALPIEGILANMKRQTRQNIKRSARDGITTREGGFEDLHRFYNLHYATSQRQRFIPYTEDYYVQMWKIFSRSKMIALILAEFNGEPISALLLIPFGDTVIAKILGWSGYHARRRPNDAVFWSAIQWSQSKGYRWFDFEGIEFETARRVLSGRKLLEDMKHSPDFIKLGYGGQVVLFPKAFERLPNPFLRWTYNKMSPKIGDASLGTQLFERLRKR